MTAPKWLTGLLVGLVLAAIGGGVGFTLWRAKTAQVQWRPLPTPAELAVWFSPAADVNPDRVADALVISEQCLALKTKWGGELARRVRPLVQVYVMPTDSWPGEKPGQVYRGQQVNDRLIIGHDLAALPHEYAHLGLRVLDGLYDDGHSTWPDAGFDAAEQCFKEWRDATVPR